MTYSRLSTSDSNIARCVVCGQIMDNGIRPRRLPSSSFIDLKITDGPQQARRLGSIDNRHTNSGSLAMLAAVPRAWSR